MVSKMFSKNTFQFQLGAIGSIVALDDLTRFSVSIPAWCDWEKRGFF